MLLAAHLTLQAHSEPGHIGHTDRYQPHHVHLHQRVRRAVPDREGAGRQAPRVALPLHLHARPQLHRARDNATQPDGHGDRPLHRDHAAAALRRGAEPRAFHLHDRHALGLRHPLRLLRLLLGLPQVQPLHRQVQLLRVCAPHQVQRGVLGVRPRADLPRHHALHLHPDIHRGPQTPQPPAGAIRLAAGHGEEQEGDHHDAAHPRYLHPLLAPPVYLLNRTHHTRVR